MIYGNPAGLTVPENSSLPGFRMLPSLRDRSMWTSQVSNLGNAARMSPVSPLTLDKMQQASTEIMHLCSIHNGTDGESLDVNKT